MARICTVFYSIEESFVIGFGQALFPGKVPGKNGWWWCMWVARPARGGGGPAGKVCSVGGGYDLHGKVSLWIS